MMVRNVTTSQVLGARVSRADTFRSRLLGLMFRSGLGQGEGLWIEPCKAVHTHFMRIPIDVLFLDRQKRVVHLIPAMGPWRHSPVVREAVSVLELPSGAMGSTSVGDVIEVR